VGYDQRGFGKSEGKRGYIESIEINIHDAELFIKKIK
jgi:acylglycerol lipase